MIAFLAKSLTNPLVVNVLAPAIANALHRFMDRLANDLEERNARKLAKNAKTIEELKNASKALSDATTRR
jgi:hypothetical protein